MALSMAEVNKKYGILGSNKSKTPNNTQNTKPVNTETTTHPDLDPRYKTGVDKDSVDDEVAKRKKQYTGDDDYDEKYTEESYGRYGESDFKKDLEKSEAEIREELARKAQKAIDAINQRYEVDLKDEAIRGEGRMGQTRAASSRGGTLSSPMGRGQLARTEQFNVAEEQRIKAERDLKKRAVEGEFDKLADDRIKAERDYAFKLKEEEDAERAEYITRGVELMTDLAKTGESWEDVNPNIREEILHNTGMSPLAARMKYNALLPTESKIDFKYEKLSDGRYLFWGLDPVTGEVVQERYEYEAPEGGELKIFDGVPYYTEDGGKTFKKSEGIDDYSRQLDMTEKEIALYQQQQDAAKSALEIEREKATMGLDIQQQKLEMDKLYKEIQQIGENDPLETKKKMLEIQKLQGEINKKENEFDDSRIKAGFEVEVLQDKIDLIDSLMVGDDAEEAIENLVGTTGLGRIPMISRWTVKNRNLVAGIKMLTDQETLDTLLQLKARGGTLGAISEKELAILQSAATKLNTWEVKDDEGNGLGRWNAGEDEFKAELQRIRDSVLRVQIAARKTAEAGLDEAEDELEFDEIDDADMELFQ